MEHLSMTDKAQTPAQDLGPEHYSSAIYDDRQRWAAYWYQLQAVRRSRAANVLEIGVGSGTLSLYLRNQLRLRVTTFDCDQRTGADVVGDVRVIRSYFGVDSFDAVLAFQVLEHIPYDDAVGVLQQIATITRRHAIISLPHCGRSLQIRVELGKTIPEAFISRKVTTHRIWEYDGLHYWEIGARQYSLARVIKDVGRYFDIKRRYFCPDFAYHYFFECEKR